MAQLATIGTGRASGTPVNEKVWPAHFCFLRGLLFTNALQKFLKMHCHAFGQRGWVVSTLKHTHDSSFCMRVGDVEN